MIANLFLIPLSAASASCWPINGFSKGCNYYLEYVEMEPGDFIVLW